MPSAPEDAIRRAFTENGLDPQLGLAIARHESNLNPQAVNMTGGDGARGGSYGSAQMSLKTAQGLGFAGKPEELLDPDTNAKYQAALVKQLHTQYGGDVRNIVSAYNSGKPYDDAPDSTRDSYVPGVMAHLNEDGGDTASRQSGPTPETGPASLEDMRKLLLSMRSKPVDIESMLPKPLTPQAPDPSIIQTALDNATRAGLVHNITHTHNPSTYEFMHGASGPTQFGGDSGKLLQQQAMAPAKAAMTGYEQAKEQAATQNKYAEDKAKLGVQAQLGEEKNSSAEMRGLLTGYFGSRNTQAKGETAKTVAEIGAKGKVTAAHITAGDSAGEIDPGIYDREADRYNTTGGIQTPKGLRGAAARKFVTEVMNRAEAKSSGSATPPRPLAQAAAESKADSASLNKLTTNADQMKVFEGTAKGNLITLRDTLAKIRDTGSPLLNKPFRQWDNIVEGSPEMAAYNAARQIVTPEVAKVLSSATGNGSLTDTSQAHVSTVLDPNATAAQQLAAIDVILRDFDNRSRSADTTKAEVSRRLAGPAASAGKVTVHEKATGKKARFDRATADQILQDPGYEEVR